MLIDTHCHFDFPPFIDALVQSIEQYQQAGVAKIIVPAVSSDRFAIVESLAHQYPSIYYALGLHPIYSHHQTDLDLLAAAIDKSHAKLVAVGEIGLDGYIEHADLDVQKLFLASQFDLAKQYHLPVILHSRKTHALLYTALKMAQLPSLGVIHGFSGSYEQAMQFIRLGFAIGVGGVISYQRANKTRDAISRIPLSSIVLETDAPDMPLYGQQGQANRPENSVLVLAHLACLRSEPLSVITETILENSLYFFPRLAR
ncbi:TatD DNase family protein [Orbus hercynius]|uniref:TatD DNase family protein n=2 Tax=Orbus hercynius TaxID=593135 RepID=A0A495RH57_9GAMM|nr:TatD DNase family protein [Orbus hercynius]